MRKRKSADLATYEEVLELLTDQAGNGSVTASVALERLLRHGTTAPIDDVLERHLTAKPAG